VGREVPKTPQSKPLLRQKKARTDQSKKKKPPFSSEKALAVDRGKKKGETMKLHQLPKSGKKRHIKSSVTELFRKPRAETWSSGAEHRKNTPPPQEKRKKLGPRKKKKPYNG